jgi:hypothetical protein
MSCASRRALLPSPSLPEVRDYLDRFLFANKMRAKIVILSRSSRGVAAMGVLDPEPGAFGPRDLALARLIGSHLGGLLDLQLARENAAAPAPALSPRQAEVAGLVVDRLTQVLSVTGCRNRTQLALLLRGGNR